MSRRTLPAIVLAVILLPLTVWPAAARQGANLLVNPGFENGFYHEGGIPELAVPNGWRLYYLDGVPFPGIDDGQLARRPETVVWYIQDAPVAERSLFFLDGNYTMKVFKPWAPLYAGLSQDVTGLEVGSKYEFTAHVYVDVVESYDGGAKQPPANEPGGVMLRTGVSPSGAAWRDESRIIYAPWVTAGNTSPFHQSYVTIRQKFTASQSAMMVWVDLVSKFAYVNNGFFMDNFELRGPINVPAPATSTPLPLTAATLAPTATPPPTATPAPQPIRYVVQRGDTLSAIARRYGLTTAALASVNGISNTDFIYTGQVLSIPAGGVVAPAPTPVPQNPAPTVAPPAGQAGRYIVQRGDSLGAIAQQYRVSISALAAANGIQNTNLIFVGQALTIPGAASPSRSYVVQRGDTLAAIAARYGATVGALQSANNLSNINFIFVGQVLTIP